MNEKIVRRRGFFLQIWSKHDFSLFKFEKKILYQQNAFKILIQKHIKFVKNWCKYELLVILTKYKDPFAKVHKV